MVDGLRCVVLVEGLGRGLEGPPDREEVRLGVERRRRVLTGFVEETTKGLLAREGLPVSGQWEAESSDRDIRFPGSWVRRVGRTQR